MNLTWAYLNIFYLSFIILNIFICSWNTSTSNASSSSPQPGNAVKRFWCLTQKAGRQSNQTSRHPGVALKFILGPAVLTVSARLFSRVAYCDADVNNFPLETATKKPAPEFKWHILWEFVKPQLFSLIGAVVVCLNPLTLISILRINKSHLFCLFSLLSQQLYWTLKSPWCLGIWWMSWRNTWENIPEIISKRSAVLHLNYLHCMVSR